MNRKETYVECWQIDTLQLKQLNQCLFEAFVVTVPAVIIVTVNLKYWTADGTSHVTKKKEFKNIQ